MNPAVFNPATPRELSDAVRSAPRVLAVGAGSKSRMSAVSGEVVRISTARLRGIVEYEPSEFTFTALAGTPVHEIVAALAERGQYLPFDPLLASAGATLGGTVAAGLNGPGRFRFGGLRDFILGVQFVDGTGRLLRLGGKVVKNAAGFDLPKFLVGSLGRFGALAEITFKVFPRPAAATTLKLSGREPAALAKVLTEAASTRWELDALEASPATGEIYARIAGPQAALPALATEVLARWSGEVLARNEADELWRRVADFAWAHPEGIWIKCALTPDQLPAFITRLPTGARAHIGAGGSVGYISLPAGALVPTLDWPALTLRGKAVLWPGIRPRFAVMQAVKQALDPLHKFPGLDE